MKVNVTVEATAQEMREFLGLPNVQPLHDEILQVMRKNVERGVVNLEALGMLKPLWRRSGTRWKWCRNSGRRSPRPAGNPAKKWEGRRCPGSVRAWRNAQTTLKNQRNIGPKKIAWQRGTEMANKILVVDDEPNIVLSLEF